MGRGVECFGHRRICGFGVRRSVRLGLNGTQQEGNKLGSRFWNLTLLSPILSMPLFQSLSLSVKFMYIRVESFCEICCEKWGV
jgi:hypothetical protein